MDTATTTEIAAGDIFASSWGYDQTNVDFYEVIGITPSGKSVRLVPIASEVVSGDAYSEQVRAVPGSAAADAQSFTKRLRFYSDGSAVVSLTSYSNAWRIDPAEAQRQSGPYGGH